MASRFFNKLTRCSINEIATTRSLAFRIDDDFTPTAGCNGPNDFSRANGRGAGRLAESRAGKDSYGSAGQVDVTCSGDLCAHSRTQASIAVAASSQDDD